MNKPNSEKLKSIMKAHDLSVHDVSLLLEGRAEGTIKGWLSTTHSYGNDAPRDAVRLIEILAPTYASLRAQLKKDVML